MHLYYHIYELGRIANRGISSYSAERCDMEDPMMEVSNGPDEVNSPYTTFLSPIHTHPTSFYHRSLRVSRQVWRILMQQLPVQPQRF